MNTLRRLLIHPQLPLITVILAVGLTLPSLWNGLSFDDYLQRLILLGDNPVSENMPATPWNMFCFHKGNDDYTIPLYLLFHEAGHSLQYREMTENGTESRFHTLINIPTGPERVAFESQSWKIGKELLTLFMAKNDLNSNILLRYENFAQKSIRTYT